jgi:hypothetical protein
MLPVKLGKIQTGCFHDSGDLVGLLVHEHPDLAYRRSGHVGYVPGMDMAGAWGMKNKSQQIHAQIHAGSDILFSGYAADLHKGLAGKQGRWLRFQHIHGVISICCSGWEPCSQATHLHGG